jgi:disulfide oxidoreductase YuzD
MGEIQTEYNREVKLVMLNDENNVVAIINVPTNGDITEQVKRAIKEELIANDVVFEKDIFIRRYDSNTHIDFIYSDEDDEEFARTFELVLTEEYR